jgi:BMFP domain-containing protein YqiC
MASMEKKKSTIGNLSSDAKVPATGLVAKFLSRNLEASREELGESVLGALRDRILAGEFATPADVEQAYDNAARDHKDLVKSLAVEDVWRFPGSQLRSTLAAMVTLQQGGGGAAKPAREVVKEVVKEVQDPAMIKKLEESVNMYNELRLASEHHMDKCKSQKVDARAKLETANARIAQLERELKAARLVASADPSSEASRAASLGIDFGKTAASEPSSQAAQAAAPPVSSPPASVSSMASQETPMTVAIPDDRVPKLLSLLAHTKNRGDVLEAKLRELASILQHRTAELAARTSESRAREGMLAERVRYLEHQITLVSGAGEAINMAMARERQLCGRIAELERMLAIGHSGGMEAPAGTAAPAGYEQSLIMSALDPDHADAARELLFDDEGPMERSENAGTPLKKKDAILD